MANKKQTKTSTTNKSVFKESLAEVTYDVPEYNTTITLKPLTERVYIYISDKYGDSVDSPIESWKSSLDLLSFGITAIKDVDLETETVNVLGSDVSRVKLEVIESLDMNLRAALLKELLSISNLSSETSANIEIFRSN